MKAISIKEPWASLITSGRKTIETRTWKTNYRGKLLLCCSKKPLISPLSGMAFAVCDLVDVRPMITADEYFARCEKYSGAYSWVLKNIKGIVHFPVKGRLGLFSVDCKLIKERVVVAG